MAASIKSAESLTDATQRPGPSVFGRTVPWTPSRELRFSERGEYELSFPRECPLRLMFFEFTLEHRLTPSFHDYLELMFVVEGEGQYLVEDRTYAVGPNDAVLVGRGDFHLMQAGPRTALKVAALHFMPDMVHTPGGPPLDAEYLKPFLVRCAPLKPKGDLGLETAGTIAQRLVQIHEEIEAERRDYPLAVKTYLADILLEVGRLWRQSGESAATPPRRTRDIERLRRVFSHIQANSDEALSLADLARVARMSPTAFCRYFKAVTGGTPTDYLLRVRVDKAADLLVTSSASVTEIAHATGFCSHSYFDRVFKRLKGMPPLDYRRQLAG